MTIQVYNPREGKIILPSGEEISFRNGEGHLDEIALALTRLLNKDISFQEAYSFLLKIQCNTLEQEKSIADLGAEVQTAYEVLDKVFTYVTDDANLLTVNQCVHLVDILLELDE